MNLNILMDHFLSDDNLNKFKGFDATYLHAEHGCVEDLPKDFPTSTCTSGTKCDIQLTEENFGNFETINAEYQFGASESNLGSITTNNALVSEAFECYQCEGYEKDVRYKLIVFCALEKTD